MVFDGLEKLIAAVGAALAAALTPIGVIYAASMNRQSKSTESSVTVLTSEVDRLEKRLEAAGKAAYAERKSGSRWYQLTVYWFNQAHDMRRYAMDARLEADSLARRTNQPVPTWEQSLTLHTMEGALPHVQESLDS